MTEVTILILTLTLSEWLCVIPGNYVTNILPPAVQDEYRNKVRTSVHVPLIVKCSLRNLGLWSMFRGLHPRPYPKTNE